MFAIRMVWVCATASAVWRHCRAGTRGTVFFHFVVEKYRVLGLALEEMGWDVGKVPCRLCVR